MKEKIWWFRGIGITEATAIGGGKPVVEAAGGGSELGQTDAAGRSVKKALKPAQLKGLASELTPSPGPAGWCCSTVQAGSTAF